MAFTLTITLDVSPPADGAVILPTPVADASTLGGLHLPTPVVDASTLGGLRLPTPATEVATAGDFSAALSTPVAALQGQDGLTCFVPSMAASFAGVIGVGAVLNASTPLPTTAFTAFAGNTLNSVAPRMATSITGSAGAVGSFSVSAPALMADLVDGNVYMSLRVPTLVSAFEAMVGTIGVLSARSPRTTAVFDGYTTQFGAVVATLPRLTAAFGALAGVIGDMTASTQAPRVSFTAVIGNTGSVTAHAAALSGSFEALSQVGGSMSASLPAPNIQLRAELIAQLLETTCMNTVTAALSHYTGGYTFNSFCELNGHYLAAGPNGLYQIEVAGDDDGAEINGLVVTGDLDFGNDKLKRVTDIYAGMRSAGNMLVRVSADESEAYEYDLETLDVLTLKQRRVFIGKGARGKYWRFEAENTAGCDFELDNMTVTTVPLERRV